jgi:hypothetical protein
MTRYIVLAFAVVIAAFAVGLGLRKLMFTEATPTLTAAPPPTAVEPSQLTVSHLQGRVELSEGGGGSWSPLAAHARVSEKAHVRTIEGASAVLSADDGLQVEVSPESQVELVSAHKKDTMLVVERGRLFARVAAKAGGLRVGVDGSDALVRTHDHDATFAVLRDDVGQVAVAVTEGDVALSAQQQHVTVGAGQQSVVAAKQPPSAPMRIPSSLFLKVSRAGPARLNRKTTEVGGETNPGASVFVNGAPVAVEADGRFTAHVPLQEGTNALKITVRDALGRSERKELAPVVVDTQPPKLKGKTIW